MANLDIVNIEGISGIGKSTQVNVLSNYFKSLGIPILTNRIGNDIGSGLKATGNTWQFLQKHPNGIVINDGSIAKMMQMEIQSGKPQSEIAQDFIGLTHEYECLNHKYNIINILISINDISVCKDRIIKRRNIFGIENPEGIEYNIDIQTLVSNGLKIFGDQVLSKSIDFHILNTHEKDSILDVHEDILKVINENFTIKNPSFEGL